MSRRRANELYRNTLDLDIEGIAEDGDSMHLRVLE